ncbi:cell wall-binding repeat-containing protein [Clostridium senegalense]|uniref:Cell wall-binding repeat-containing protein n=1 Tax=Clostridium senegalense TaxID=1465809 RepID=A0A6M0H3M8_9CLOT|nr:cell wall-binding repeat-containing protein [Clostridium senegalense]
MNKKITCLLIGAMVTGMCFAPINAYASNDRVTRIGGTDRHETSIEIADKFIGDEKIDSVILIEGDDYPDSLTGSILSKKYNAPIISLRYSPKNSVKQIEFIKTHLKTDGTIYLLGGEKLLTNSYVDEFNKLGYKNIERISGNDRFETNKKIVEEVNVEEGTPVIIASSEKFADALSMSSISGAKQYPILLTEKYILSPSAREQIEKIKPKEVFITGGVEAISDEVQNEIEYMITNTEGSKVVRLAGKDRYETSMEVLNHFKEGLNGENIFVTGGKSFSNALLGASLASKTESPILLSESQSIVDSKPELDNYKSVNIIGGKFSVEVFTEQRLNNEKEFSFKATSFYEENGKKYMTGTFNKLSKDTEEVEEYCNFYKLESHVIYEKDREAWIPDCGQDIPMSTPVKVEISDDVEIKVIEDEKISPDNLLGTNPITFDELKTRTNWTGHPLFQVEFENNKISKITQDYRP